MHAARRLLRALALAAAAVLAGPAATPAQARAGEALVAVAANFRGAMESLAPAFEAESGHSLRVISGATGKLYAQIINGAPVDVLLAADQARPARLNQDGLVVPGARFTYAIGRLALWSATEGDPEARLRAAAPRRVALANPETAPYGRAAEQAIARLGLAGALQGKLVRGQSVGQVHAMLAAGAAEMGFVSLAQARAADGGAYWLLPETLHDPIRQDAALLARAERNPAAIAFFDWMRSDHARAALPALGYAAPQKTPEASR